MVTCLSGHTSAVALLLESGALVDEIDLHGNTALFFAIESKCDEKLAVLRILVNKNAQLNHQNYAKVKLLGKSANEDIGPR